MEDRMDMKTVLKEATCKNCNSVDMNKAFELMKPFQKERWLDATAPYDFKKENQRDLGVLDDVGFPIIVAEI
jgi:hypothetical protein